MPGKSSPVESSRIGSHRDIFFAAHAGPYRCVFCGRSVRRDRLDVHHLDRDHENNAVENLAPAHKRCHNRWHMSNPTVEHRSRLSAAATRRFEDPAERERMAVALRGKRHTAERRANESAAAKRRLASPEARRERSEMVKNQPRYRCSHGYVGRPCDFTRYHRQCDQPREVVS